METKSIEIFYTFFIQGQFNITQQNYCIFIVWTPKALK